MTLLLSYSDGITWAATMLLLAGIAALVLTLGKAKIVSSPAPIVFISSLMIVVASGAIFLIALKDGLERGRLQDFLMLALILLCMVLLSGVVLLKFSVQQDLKLRSAIQCWNAMFNSSTDGMVLLDSNLRVKMMNEAARRILMLDDRAEGRSIGDLLRLSDRGLEADLEQIAARNSESSLMVTLGGKDGQEHRAALSVYRINDLLGSGDMLLILRDITNLERFERKKALLQAREEMLRIADHEIRTPVSVIRGCAELIKKDREFIPVKVMHHVELMTSQAERIVDLLHRIAHGSTGTSLNLHQHDTDLVQLVREVVHRFEVTHSSRRLVFYSQVEKFEVFADHTLLEQAIANVISNGLKYSPEETQVVVHLEMIEADGLLVKISDQGKGILPKDKGLIFEPFSRGSNVGDVSGAGLGLYFARMIVESHGGNIWVEDNVPKGSTFCITFPKQLLLEATGNSYSDGKSRSLAKLTS